MYHGLCIYAFSSLFSFFCVVAIVFSVLLLSADIGELKITLISSYFMYTEVQRKTDAKEA